MAGWESLRGDLLRLREESPGALVVWPNPHTERRFRIVLAAWATEIAGTLKAKYGDLLSWGMQFRRGSGSWLSCW